MVIKHIFERLDRALCNDQWRITFPNVGVRVLPHVEFSDVHPILISLNSMSLFPFKRRFRFECAQISHASYRQFMEEQWRNDVDLIHNVVNMEHQFTEWKYNVLGSINVRKKNLLAKIGGIQRRIQESCGNNFLFRLEKDLQRQLDLVLHHEAMSWYQRSRKK